MQVIKLNDAEQSLIVFLLKQQKNLLEDHRVFACKGIDNVDARLAERIEFSIALKHLDTEILHIISALNKLGVSVD